MFHVPLKLWMNKPNRSAPVSDDAMKVPSLRKAIMNSMPSSSIHDHCPKKSSVVGAIRSMAAATSAGMSAAGSKIVAASLVVSTIVLLYLVWHYFIDDELTLGYISAGIVAPQVYVLYQLIVSREKKGLHLASRTMKIVMFAGIIYSLLVKAIITWNLI